MDWPGTSLETNFEELKEDLSASMRMCRTSFDQFNRVMFTISELLYSGISNMQDGTAFKSALALEAAYGVMSRCTNPESTHEAVLLKFARAFIPFMDYLGANKLTQIDEAAPTLHKRTPKPEVKKSTGTTANVRTVTRSGRIFNTVAIGAHTANSKPSSSSKATSAPSKAARRITLRPTGSVKSESGTICCAGDNAQSSMLFTPLVEPKYEHAMEEPSTSTRPDDSDDWIKKEEEDYDEDLTLRAGQGTNGQTNNEDLREIKKEEDLIKEEPIEQPFADRVVIESRSGKFSLARRKMPLSGPITKQTAMPRPITKQPTRMSGSGTLQLFTAPHSCMYCYMRLPKSKMEHHVKIYHKEKWLKFVRTCSEGSCDFRSAFPKTIQQHQLSCHNDKFERWKKSVRFELPVCTKCPYCTQHLTDLSQFVRHLEFYHPRLCTYEVPILKCNNCDFTSSRTFEMFIHWHESAKCTQGLRFVYETAVRVVHADQKRKRLEVEPGPTQRMPHLTPAQ